MNRCVWTTHIMWKYFHFIHAHSIHSYPCWHCVLYVLLNLLLLCFAYCYRRNLPSCSFCCRLVAFATHIVTVRNSMYIEREGFLRDRLVCLLCILIPCLHGTFNMIPVQMVFTHNFSGKSKDMAHNKNPIDFSCKQCFFAPSRFFFSFARWKHKQWIQQMTPKSTFWSKYG